MREWHDRDALELVSLADAHGQLREAEQAPQGEPAGGDDQLRPQELELPSPPERAQLPLTRSRRAVAASRRRAPRIAPRHRCAVERRVEGVLLEVEPAAERLAGPAPPRQSLLALDDAGRLSEEIRALTRMRGAHRPRLERVAGFDARPAAREISLERDDRSIR